MANRKHRVRAGLLTAALAVGGVTAVTDTPAQAGTTWINQGYWDMKEGCVRWRAWARATFPDFATTLCRKGDKGWYFRQEVHW